MSDGRPDSTPASYPPMRPDLLERYLALLGVPGGPPSPQGLERLVQAQLRRVPFENISKLHYRDHRGLRGLPGLGLYLDGIERFNFGGTCYPNNYYFGQLLANLGYRAVLCGADMANPDVHLVSMVEIEEREYIVDVGYAAPFETPLPRDLTMDYVVRSGRDRYVLRPRDEAGRSRLELHRDGELKHGYLAKPGARQITEFEAVITDSYRDESTFMTAILLARLFEDHFLVIHNLTVIESRGADFSLRTLADRDELAHVVAEDFGIPPEITGDVVHGLASLGDAWQ